MAVSIGLLRRFGRHIRLTFTMLGDYFRGRYRRFPGWTLAAFAVVLVYVIDPFDFIPDWIPFFGQIDDAAIFALGALLAEKDLRHYRAWRGAP